MKRIASILIGIVLLCTLAACTSGAESSEPAASEADMSGENMEEANAVEANKEGENTEEAAVEETGTGEAETAETQNDSSADEQTGGSNILIAYFTMPEDVDTSGVDAIAGASIVVRDGEAVGNVEYMANVIAETVGADLFRIETVQQYPLEHEALVDQAAQEQDADARPELATHIENLEQYDTIFLGYPNWWGDMPQALYTFLEEYDFSGKTIIPFCPHGGSGFSRTESTIAELQPDATVSEEGLAISRNNVAGSAEQVADWSNSLGL